MKNRVYLLITALLCNINIVTAQRETKIINNDWKFRFSHQVEKNSEKRVDLPHTWNAQDITNGKLDYKRGIGNYSKKLVFNPSWKDKRVFIKFNGANSVADIFFNGKHIGEHKGGYTSFIIELTDKIDWSKDNTILARINNAERLDLMPLVGDFNFYGGLYRDVELIATEPVSISLFDYASDGVYIEQNSVTKDEAKINVRTLLTNPFDKQKKAKINISIFDGDKLICQEEKKVTIKANEKKQNESVSLLIKKPHLWNGKKDPFMYSVNVSLYIDDKKVDEVIQPMGLRYFSVDPNKGFFLNGEHLTLKGVCRHKDRPEIGNAIRKEHHQEDIDIMNEMGANAVRLSHYPQDKYFLNLLDKHGYIVWSEIPFVGPGGYEDKGYVNSESFHANGKEQLKELIRQNFNHPSICFWGLFNELKENGDNPVEYIKELNQLSHNEDNTRPTTAASNQDGNLNFITDLIAWNKYDGWYGATPKTLATWLDKMHKQNPQLKIGISEYGAGASIYHQQDILKQPVPNSFWHPENWQTYYHIKNWEIISARPFVWGSFIWNMFDFGAAHRTEGDRLGINDKGLVTFDRKVKKDAFYFYKANWNKEDAMIHISGKRSTNRTKAETEVIIFTNQKQVTLFLNGKEIATKEADNLSMCTFPITLQFGDNIIEARTNNLVDKCVWTLF